MERTFIGGERERTRSYSRAVVTSGGRTVYLAGVVDVDADGGVVTGGPEASTRAAFERLRDAVEVAGGTLADIVTMTVHITDARYGDAFAKVRAEYFDADAYPASTLVTCVALARPELTIEITAVAVLPD